MHCTRCLNYSGIRKGYPNKNDYRSRFVRILRVCTLLLGILIGCPFPVNAETGHTQPTQKTSPTPASLPKTLQTQIKSINGQLKQSGSTLTPLTPKILISKIRQYYRDNYPWLSPRERKTFKGLLEGKLSLGGALPKYKLEVTLEYVRKTDPNDESLTLRVKHKKSNALFGVKEKQVRIVEKSAYRNDFRNPPEHRGKLWKKSDVTEAHAFDPDWKKQRKFPTTISAKKRKIVFPDYYKKRWEGKIPSWARSNHTHDVQVKANKSNLEKLVDYFSPGQNRTQLQTRVKKAFAKSKDGQIPLESFLPEMARKRCHCIPTNDVVDGDNSVNCHCTTRNFFKRDVKLEERDMGEGHILDILLKRQYCEVTDQPTPTIQFGDILRDRFMDHSVRVLFKDANNTIWVYSKADGGDDTAWVIVPLEQAFGKYYPQYQGGQAYILAQLNHYRRCR